MGIVFVVWVLGSKTALSYKSLGKGAEALALNDSSVPLSLLHSGLFTFLMKLKGRTAHINKTSRGN